MKLRYKQTVIGVGWVILQPLITMLIFTAIFGYMVRIPSDGQPYAVFAFTALLPWTYFSQAINRSGISLVYNSNLITKVFFPRLLVPFAAIVGPIVELCLSFLILLLMLAWFGIPLSVRIITLPLFILLALMTALGVGLFLSAANVKYRDIENTIPFLLQIWMYASPVVYPVSLVPEAWRPFYSLNPMVGVIEGFRWALLRKASPDLEMLACSAAIAIVLIVGGLIYFKRAERTFADVI